MAGKSANSLGSKNWSPGPPSTRYNVSGKNREFYTFENAPGIGAYATGGTIIDGGDGYIYHIFTGDGTFSVSVNRPPAAIDSVDYLIVAGGGGATPGGAAAVAGGGGGGFLFGNLPISAPGVYPVQVGGGGPSAPGAPGTPRNGSPSWFGGPGTLESTGGGGGAGSSPTAQPGANGGSGGGGTNSGVAGSGNSPATIPRQGYPGGASVSPNLTGASGGGGGAGGVASAGTTPPSVAGVGGPGRIAPEFPSSIISKAIPAPVLPAWNPLVGPGGYAAGGTGSPTPTPLQRTSPANSGYGGQNGGFTGGSGIVCIRYKKTVPYSRATGGTIEPSTHPEHPGVWRHIFTSPGDFTVTDPTLQYIDYLAVGGGGGGGGNPTPAAGGGGGAGGFVSSIHTSTTTPTTIPQAYPWNPGYSVQVGEQYFVGIGTYPIGIGTGGNASTVGNDTTIGNPGPSQIIAYGGGRGGLGGASVGGAGASGGGGSKLGPPATPVVGGTATPTPFIQGNTGGSTPATPQPGPNGAGGGGAGTNGSGGGTGGSGGSGWYSVLSPSAYGTPGPLTPTSRYRYFAGGGGGGPSGSGGSGGGGAGGVSTGNPGTTNTGGGGGGGAIGGGTGGPGIVIIQYPE